MMEASHRLPLSEWGVQPPAVHRGCGEPHAASGARLCQRPVQAVSCSSWLRCIGT